MIIDQKLNYARVKKSREKHKKTRVTTIDTPSIEQEVLRHYNDKTIDAKTKQEFLKIMIDIWKNKNKIPVPVPDAPTLDFSALMNNAPEPAAPE